MPKNTLLVVGVITGLRKILSNKNQRNQRNYSHQCQPRINGLKFLVPISIPAARQTVLSPNLKFI